jgi:pyridoxamine 5'-phosphate oxidase
LFSIEYIEAKRNRIICLEESAFKMNPFDIFNQWFKLELESSPLDRVTACCMSTIGLDGYPNSRIVALKDYQEDRFIFTGSKHSRKAIELNANRKASLVFWWPNTGRQIRVQGDVNFLSDQSTGLFFQKRPRNARIVSHISKQGELLINRNHLLNKFHSFKREYEGKEIPAPDHWGGFMIIPVRIEFFEFNEDRLHRRLLYTRENGVWQHQELQP